MIQNEPQIDDFHEKVTEIIENRPPQHQGWFKVNQIIIIDDKYFRIKSVKPNEIRLKLIHKPIE